MGKKLNKKRHTTRKSGMAFLLSASLAANMPGGFLGENLALAAQMEKENVSTGLEALKPLEHLGEGNGVAVSGNESTGKGSENQDYVEGEAIILYKDSGVKAFSGNGSVLVQKNGELQGEIEDGIEIVDTCKFAANKGQKGVRSNSLNAKNCYVSLVRSDKYSTEELIQKLKEKKDIQYAEPNYKVKALDMNEDPYEKYQWALKNYGQNGGTQGFDTDAIDTDLQQDSDQKEKVIALVDTGADYTSADLKNVMWTNTNSAIQGLHGYDFVNNDTDPMDDNGHGSHCAGIMAAEAGNGVGTSGIARSKNIKIMALKTLNASGEGENYSFVKAYNYIYEAQQAGVNVVAVNNSWGGSSKDSTSDTLDELMNKVGEAGALSICAAGNDGEDNDQVVSLPANSDSPYVISVAASNEKDELAGFSNYGKNNVDLAAPGADILSTVATDTFNPGIYENKDALCSKYEDFSDGNLVETVGTHASGQQAQDGDIAYGTYEVGASSWGNTTKAQGQVSVELSHENYFGIDQENGKSLKWKISGAKSGETYCLYLPYTANKSNTPLYDSVMVRAVGSNAGQNEILYVADGKLAENGYHLEDLNYVGSGGTYIDKRGNYWTHVSGTTSTSGPDEDQSRSVVLMIQAKSSGDYTVYVDDFGISKSDVNADQFGKYDFYNGTSMATPYVTGAVAVLANAFSEDTPGERKDKILNHVRKSEDLTDKVSTGGVLDLSQIHKETQPAEEQKDFEKVGQIKGTLSDGIIVSGGDSISYVKKDGEVSTGKKDAENHLQWETDSADFKDAWEKAGMEQPEQVQMETGVVRNANKLWTVLSDGANEDNSKKVLVSYQKDTGWKYETELPETWKDLTHFTLAVYQGKIYVLGGLKQSDGTCAKSVCAYNLETDAWENVADMPEGRAFAKGGQSASKLILSMGYSQEQNGNSINDLIFDGGNWTSVSNEEADKYSVPTKQYQWQMSGNTQTINYYDSPVGVDQNGFIYVGWNVNGQSEVVLKNEETSQIQCAQYSYRNQIGNEDIYDAATAGDSLYILKQSEQDQNEQTIEVLRMPVATAAIEVKNTSDTETTWKGSGWYLPGEMIVISPEEAKYFKNVKVNGVNLSIHADGNCYYIARNGESIDVATETGRAIVQIQMDDQLELYPGDKYQLAYTILPEDAEDKELTWESLDDKVVQVDENGLLQVAEDAQPGQEVEIRVASKRDSKINASCKITILEKEEPTTEETTAVDTETTTEETTEANTETITEETTEADTETTTEEITETETAPEETTEPVAETTETDTEATTEEPIESETESTETETAEEERTETETTEEETIESTTEEYTDGTTEEITETEPIVPDPTTEEPTELTTEEPTAPDPTTEEPTTEEPTAPDPTTESVEETTEEETTIPDSESTEETVEPTIEETTEEETTEEETTTRRWQWPTWWWEETTTPEETTEEKTTEETTIPEETTTTEETIEETTTEEITEYETTEPVVETTENPTEETEETSEPTIEESSESETTEEETTTRGWQWPTWRPEPTTTEIETSDAETTYSETTQYPVSVPTTKEMEQITQPVSDRTTEQSVTVGMEDNRTTTHVENGSVKVSLKHITIKAGQSRKISTTQLGVNANKAGITYKSSNQKIASVTKNGKVVAKSAGFAKITVGSVSGNKLVIMLTVIPKKVTKVKVKWNRSGKICFTWKKQNKVKGYRIYQYNAKKKKYCIVKTVKKNSYIFKKKNIADTAKFKIRAYQKSGSRVLMGEYSKTIQVRVR